MTDYTGYEYLQSDVASNAPFDLDKLPFEKRIAWTQDNDAILEEFLTTQEAWKEKPLFNKAVIALRKTQQGIKTGHMCHLDAVCSGMQIMSALTGCMSGAGSTGLVHKDVRSDAYADVQNIMSADLGKELTNARKDVKLAVMSSLYGSKQEPKSLFGDDTPELEAFQKALYKTAPGAVMLLQKLISSWNPGASLHQWQLPDGGVCKVKVMVPKTVRIEVDELAHTTFTYAYEDNEPTEYGLSLAANVVHSCDAYLLRSLIRRCSYNHERVTVLNLAITEELLERELGVEPAEFSGKDESLDYYMNQYARSGVVDPVIIPYLDENLVTILPTAYLAKLNSILEMMLQHKPFPIVTVHDSFAASPNNLNSVRLHYKNILADMSESDMLSDLLTQINGSQVNVSQINPDLHKIIRESNYAIC